MKKEIIEAGEKLLREIEPEFKREIKLEKLNLLRVTPFRKLDSELGYLVNISDNHHGAPDTFVKEIFLDYLSLFSKNSDEQKQQDRERISYEGELAIDCIESISLVRQYAGLTRQAISNIAKELE